MKTRAVHQTRLVLIAFLIAFGLPGISYADGSSTIGTPGLAYSPDGGTLASGGRDQTVRLWDATTGELLNTFKGHTYWVESVAYSPDGHTLASGGRTKVRFWDITPYIGEEPTAVDKTSWGLKQHGNTNAEPFPRDETIRAIRKWGRRAWKKTSGYHRRSIAETQIGRYKQMIGDTLRARTRTNQQTETRLGCALLNRMRALAKPESYPLTKKA